MKIWKRALLYLIRKKGRSILIIVLIFGMASLILSGNALRNSTNKEIEKIRKNLASSFVISADTENESLYKEQYDEAYSYKTFVGRTISQELIDEIMNVEGVTDCEIGSYELAWVDLQLKEGLWADSTESDYITEEEILVRRKTTMAFVCGNGETNVNFRTGAFSVSQGRNILKEDEFVAVISEYVSKENHIQVGDKLILESKRGIYEPCDVPSERYGSPVEVEIVGIFSVNFEQEASVYTPEDAYADNFLFIDRATGLQLKRNRESDQIQEKYGKVTFLVNNPEELDNIMARVKECVDLNGLLISVDDSAYRASVKPLKQIGIFASILMVSGIVGCIFILYLMLALWIKGRKNEIGILLSIGISKGKIVSQFIIESTIIVAISLMVTFFLARPITDNFFSIAEKIVSPRSDEVSYSIEMEYGEMVPTITKISSEVVDLKSNNSKTDVLFLIITIYIISYMSVLLASIQVMSMNPKLLLQSN